MRLPETEDCTDEHGVFDGECYAEAIDRYEDEQRDLTWENHQEEKEARMAKQIVKFDRAKLIEFKKHYEQATKMHLETMMFDGNEYVMTYAKYLIEYLEGAKT